MFVNFGISKIYPSWYPTDIGLDSSFFRTGASQLLEVEYIAQQIVVFAYVSDGFMNFMYLQESERVNWTDFRRAISSYAGFPTTNKAEVRNLSAISQNYANVIEPATKFHNSNWFIYRYYTGDKWYKFDGVNKGKIETSVYGELYSIPGI